MVLPKYFVDIKSIALVSLIIESEKILIFYGI